MSRLYVAAALIYKGAVLLFLIGLGFARIH